MRRSSTRKRQPCPAGGCRKRYFFQAGCIETIIESFFEVSPYKTLWLVQPPLLPSVLSFCLPELLHQRYMNLKVQRQNHVIIISKSERLSMR